MQSTTQLSLKATPMQSVMALPLLRGDSFQPYTQQLSWQFFESLDVDLFKKAWRQVLNRHDVFRYRFQLSDEGRVQLSLADRLQVKIKFHDLQKENKPLQKARLRKFKSEDLRRGFVGLQQLCRFNLFQLDASCFELVWTSHHCLFDGRSRLILIREFLDVYSSLISGVKPHLQKTYSFKAYLNWISKSRFEDSKKFWVRYLKSLEESTPLSFRGKAVVQKRSSHDYKKSSHCLSESMTSRLHRWTKRTGFSHNILFQAAWATYLWRTSGKEFVVFGSPRACRMSSVPGAKQTVGLFVNTVPVGIRFKKSDSVGDLLKSIRKGWQGMRAHEHTPAALIKQASGIASNKPLFESLIGFEKYQLSDVVRHGGKPRFQFSLEGFTDLPLVIQVYDGSRIQIVASFDSLRFQTATIISLITNLETIVTQLIGDSSQPLSSLHLLSGSETRLAHRLGRGKSTQVLRPLVHEQFEYIAKRYPNNTAVRLGTKNLNYQDLNEQSNQLARYLVRRGVKPGMSVGLFLERDVTLIISLLAILKTGSAYVPFDIEYPEDRLKWMVSDSKPAFVLVTSNLKDEFKATKLNAIYVDKEVRSTKRFSRRNLNIGVTQGSPANIMYTSGSTGKPKGVVVPHRGINRLVLRPNYVKLNSNTRILQMAPVSFDASTFEIWGALLNGGTCVLYPGRVPDLVILKNLVRKRRINTLFLTTALFNLIVDAAPKSLSGIKQLLVGGEILSTKHIRKALEVLKETRISNLYGPTENTTFSCFHPIPRNYPVNKAIPIGKPIQESSTYILDNCRQLLPVGVAGELYVGGKGVALGYLNQPELTEERFLQNPFSVDPSDRLYRTGDKVYLNENGDIEFLGRFDDQLKIRGHRIEPGEIQSELLQHPQIKEVYVKAVVNKRGETELAAFLVKSNSPKFKSDTMQSWLASRMPNYMVPSHFIFLDSLPLTANGKVNNQALIIQKNDRTTPETSRFENITGTERFLLKSWEKILGETPANLHTSFFDAGGHSLLVTSLLFYVETHFKVHVPFCQIREHQSIHKLANLIDALSKRKVSQTSANTFKIKPVRIKRITPLSRTWRGKYFGYITDPNLKGQIIARAYMIKGALKKQILTQALDHVINIHERLRTRVIKIDGEYLEEIQPRVKINFPYHNFTKLGLDAAMAKARKMFEKEGLTPMDFRTAPLVRMQLFKLAKDQFCFLFRVHHAAVDGASLVLLLNQISTTYEELVAGKSPSIKPSRFSFRQYEESYKAWMTSNNRNRITEFWKQQVKNSRIYHLPIEKRRIPQNLELALMDDYVFEASWANHIQDFCETQGISKYIFLLTLGSILVSRYTGHLTSQVTSSSNARTNLDEMEIVGEKTSLIFVHHKLQETQSFIELANNLMDKAYHLLEHSNIEQKHLADLFPPAKGSAFEIL
ncbi:MAG: amino acid adenylation domain-containing protein, partial [Verrucomicrobia bacterium]|nr:amino acid adenylation domain-containing protein [Verrucomicrobiota bacterium]